MSVTPLVLCVMFVVVKIKIKMKGRAIDGKTLTEFLVGYVFFVLLCVKVAMHLIVYLSLTLCITSLI